MSDYVPPGLGRTLEDLISKHAGKGKPESTYQWALRNAARTRATLAKMSGTPAPAPEPVVSKPERPAKRTVKKATKRSTRRKVEEWGKGREAYQWAYDNGKSAAEAARHFGINPGLVHSHKRHFELPDLADGRVRSGNYRTMLARKKEIRKHCAVAYERMRKERVPYTKAVEGLPISGMSLIRYCIRNGLDWVRDTDTL